MKKLNALVLALSLCISLSVSAFAAYIQYDKIELTTQCNTVITFEQASFERMTFNLITQDIKEPKTKEVPVYLVKPGSNVTVSGTTSSYGMAAYTYDKQKNAYCENPAVFIDMTTGPIENAFKKDSDTFDLLHVPETEYFIKIGDASAPTAPGTVGGFNDVKVDAYYADPVKWAVKNKVTAGTSETTFSPDLTCTNAQFLTFMWRAVGSIEPTSANPFSNLSGSEYYAKAAIWAYEKNLISGSEFESDKPCTRAMAVNYLWKYATGPNVESSAKFTDVSADAEYAPAVAWAVELKITSGTSETTFSPDLTCTRGQIVTFLYRALAL